VKISILNIPPEGVVIKELVPAKSLDLDTDLVSFDTPLMVTAEVSRITNAVSVNFNLSATMNITCSRCLLQKQVELDRSFRVDYPLDKHETEIDFSSDIREELILSYPIKTLCSSDCRGICLKCGKNLNEGGCNCAIT
jgi:uncharacterized protein